MSAVKSEKKSWIQKTPGVCGGEACIGRRRIPVWQLVESRRLGATDELLLTMYDPPLTRDELAAAWEYYASHQSEIDRAIWENQAAMLDKTTRSIPVWFVERGRRLGLTELELCAAFEPQLTTAELESAWREVAANQAEVDRDLREKFDP